MKSSVFYIFCLTIGLLCSASASAVTFHSVLDACMKAELSEPGKCAKGPFCTGYPSMKPADDSENICTNANAFGSADCPVFFSVTKSKGNKFEVVLAGKTGSDGFVSLGFQEQGNPDFPVIVCRAGAKSISTSKKSSQPAYATDASNEARISEPSVVVDKEWLICQFKLTPEAPFDVTNNQKRMYMDKGEGGKITFEANSPDTEDFWSYLEGDGTASVNNNNNSSGGSRPMQPRMAFVMLLVAAALYAITRQ